MCKFTQVFQCRFISGQATEMEIIEAMAELVRAGEHLRARGYYRRLAQTLIDGEWISDRGAIL